MKPSVTPSVTLSIEENPNREEFKVVGQGKRDSDLARVGENIRKPLHVLLRDENGAVVGGMTASISWQWLYVGNLWIPENLRGQGYGSAVLKTVEEEAARQGCKSSFLSIYDFQSPEFFEKQGYVRFAELPNLLPNHSRYYFTKKLTEE